MTADGCPVDLWAALPAGDIPTVLKPAIGARNTVLDLGAGAGRLTHPLVAMGHAVTAVDESAQMLSHIHDATTICSTIEDLRLDRVFDVVLLASHLVNVPDATHRHRLLTTCQQHLAPAGVVLIQRYTPEWASRAGGRTDLGAGIVQELELKPGPPDSHGLVSAVATYVMGTRRWEHRHTSPDRSMTTT